jgi:hypothetical protein
MVYKSNIVIMYQKKARVENDTIHHDTMHQICNFLDRYDFAALEMMSRSMRENLRMIIMARNSELSEEKRIPNLERPFCVWVALKELLKREGRHPLDIIATGGYVIRQKVNTVMSLDLVTMRYTTLTPMINPRQNHATVVHDGKLFVMGGFNYGTLPSVECLDLETMQWSEMAPMITPRDSHGAAVLGGKIYVAGGYPLSRVGTLVESFDADTNQWTAVTPMNTRRDQHGLVSAQGNLYAVGGNNLQHGHSGSVECFDPSTGVWSNIAPLNTSRDALALALLDNKLYAIGGYDPGLKPLRSVECMDMSVPISGWTTVAPMTSPRWGMKAVVTGGKIYIVGGHGSSSIECFDPRDGPSGRWTVVSETSQFQNEAITSAY